ncbi:hypothetical protein DGG96_19085 [Legionella qingyii]|uniref:Uncharacterized protein n=1 Tax=Legionella qingyii TaxID=2184757 RepID=A0A317U106_9GAMM|nr:hypothetical protein [Legionella qingyii]PWY54060.1 hypothetical protein DGG96_19085 [Legionella qingyii]RUR19157.1 hypothetical protein ELY20_16090 [Legionella qingyii]RUR22887.1 hypothetical protein ELY16_14080 [Legionella qingyii]
MSKELIELSKGNSDPLLKLLKSISNNAQAHAQQYALQKSETVTQDMYITFLKKELIDYHSRFKLDDKEIKKYCDLLLNEFQFTSNENERLYTDALAWLWQGLNIQSTQTDLSQETKENIEYLNQINQLRTLRNVYEECFKKPHEDYAQHLSSELEKECQQWGFSDHEPIPQTEINTMVRQIKGGKEVTLSTDFQNGVYDKVQTANILKIVNKANLNAKVLQAGDNKLNLQGITEINAPIDYYKIKLEASAKLSTPEYLAQINEDRHSSAQKVIKGFELFVKFLASLVTQSGLGLEDIAKEIDNREKREKISIGVEKFKEIKSSLSTLKSECTTEVVDTDLSSQGLTAGNN